MNLKTEKGTTTLSNAVESRLTITSYGSGAMEQATEIANQTASAFGDLIDLLASKGVLNPEESLRFTNYTLTGWNAVTFEP